MRRFWGLPIGLGTLPNVTANARAKSMSFGGRLCFFANASITGVPIIARVSFMRNADASPAPNRMESISASTEPVFLKALYDKWDR